MLARNPEAQQLHDEGLAAELRGDFDAAHSSFYEAQQVLGALDQTLDVGVQTARVVRDDGFAYVREAVATFRLQPMGRARELLKYAARMTGALFDDIPLNEFSSSETGELSSEHGATIGALGRMATVSRVRFGVIEAASDEGHPYGEGPAYRFADRFLQLGNNGYYWVSNAMNAARAERAEGRLLQASKWLGTAATGLAWTATYDRSNLGAARRTFGGRLPHLRSRQAAIDSVGFKP